MTETLEGVYKPSGRMGPALLAVPAALLVAVPLLSIIYAYVLIYTPIAGYVSILIVGGYAYAIGWLVSHLGWRFRCRCPKFLGATGILGGIFGLYASWAAFAWVLIGRAPDAEDISLLGIWLSPGGLWWLAGEIAKEGWYSVMGLTPSGVVLWSFWGIEALVVVGLPAFIAPGRIREEVFCEKCGRWCRKSDEAVLLKVPEDSEALRPLGQGRADPLESLNPSPVHEYPRIRVDVRTCSMCQSTMAVRAKLVTFVTDKDGKSQEQENDLSESILVGPSFLARLQTRTA